MTVKVLLTCVGGELAPEMIISLKSSIRHDVIVIGVDANEQAAGRIFCDEFAVVPFGSDISYVKKIIELIVRYDIDLIIPTSDEEALALSAAKEELVEYNTTLACVDRNTLDILTDKAKTYGKLVDSGIHVPNWRHVSDSYELRQVVPELFNKYGDIVVKPVCERGGRGVHVVSHSQNGVRKFLNRREIHSDLETFVSELSGTLNDSYPVIVMERLVEPVFDLDMLAWNGKSVRVVPRRRMNSALPNEGHIIVDSPELIDLGNKLIDIFQLSWLYDCDVMYDQKGSPCVLEINPRQSGSISVSIAAGIPIFDELISLFLGEIVSTNLQIHNECRVIPYKSLAVIK